MIGFLALAAAALQPGGWSVSAPMAAPHAETASADQPRRVEPVGGYTLALIWTPEHCLHAVPGAESFACDSKTGTRFALHGLWPDGIGKSWPQWCKDAAILPQRLLLTFYRATPSAQLMQHEWAKHGTCMSVTAEAYFRQSSRLFLAVRYPDMAALGRATLNAGAFAQAFAAANPGMRPDMLNLNLDHDGWLREVWLCLDTKFKSEPCKTPVAADRAMHVRLSD